MTYTQRQVGTDVFAFQVSKLRCASISKQVIIALPSLSVSWCRDTAVCCRDVSQEQNSWSTPDRQRVPQITVHDRSSYRKALGPSRNSDLGMRLAANQSVTLQQKIDESNPRLPNARSAPSPV